MGKFKKLFKRNTKKTRLRKTRKTRSYRRKARAMKRFVKRTLNSELETKQITNYANGANYAYPIAFLYNINTNYSFKFVNFSPNNLLVPPYTTVLGGITTVNEQGRIGKRIQWKEYSIKWKFSPNMCPETAAPANAFANNFPFARIWVLRYRNPTLIPDGDITNATTVAPLNERGFLFSTLGKPLPTFYNNFKVLKIKNVSNFVSTIGQWAAGSFEQQQNGYFLNASNNCWEKTVKLRIKMKMDEYSYNNDNTVQDAKIKHNYAILFESWRPLNTVRDDPGYGIVNIKANYVQRLTYKDA